ncbi:MAG: hypothetical protein M3Y76_09170 [Chloroflexota bacterium]|nr:hypothetical protein [Chloroflexota bacterium]
MPRRGIVGTALAVVLALALRLYWFPASVGASKRGRSHIQGMTQASSPG